jgi:hypothetical protein
MIWRYGAWQSIGGPNSYFDLGPVPAFSHYVIISQKPRVDGVLSSV